MRVSIVTAFLVAFSLFASTTEVLAQRGGGGRGGGAGRGGPPGGGMSRGGGPGGGMSRGGGPGGGMSGGERGGPQRGGGMGGGLSAGPSRSPGAGPGGSMGPFGPGGGRGPERPGGERPSMDRPGAPKPGAERPGAERPGGVGRPGVGAGGVGGPASGVGVRPGAGAGAPGVGGPASGVGVRPGVGAGAPGVGGPASGVGVRPGVGAGAPGIGGPASGIGVRPGVGAGAPGVGGPASGVGAYPGMGAGRAGVPGDAAAYAYGTRYRSAAVMADQTALVRASTYPAYGAAFFAGQASAWPPANLTNPSLYSHPGYAGLAVGLKLNQQPAVYDYGANVVVQQDSVYVNGESAGTTQQYAEQASQIAATGASTQPAENSKWLPLGVFALVEDGQSSSNDVFQLAVNPQGLIRGNYHNTANDSVESLSGSVDRDTQRAAWTIGSDKAPVYEAGISNLTRDATPVLIHIGDGQTRQLTLIRLEDQPAQ